MEVDQGTFIVGRTKLEPGQTLAPDLSTYEMLHSLSTPWPCLSFDVARDSLGDNRKAYPATMYTVAGTQADSAKAQDNQLLVMKFSGLSRMDRQNEEESDNEDDDDDEDSDPILESKAIPINSATNRIRSHQIPSQEPGRPPTTLTATMTESSNIYIHDVTPHLASFDNPGTTISAQQNKPISTIRAHKSEGYAVDWSPIVPGGKLLTGDNDGQIYVTTRTDGGAGSPTTGHSRVTRAVSKRSSGRRQNSPFSRLLQVTEPYGFGMFVPSHENRPLRFRSPITTSMSCRGHAKPLTCWLLERTTAHGVCGICGSGRPTPTSRNRWQASTFTRSRLRVSSGTQRTTPSWRWLRVTTP